jgi:hypothetical protein
MMAPLEGAVTVWTRLPKHPFLILACHPRLNLFVISIKNAILIYFDCAPAILITICSF